MPRTSQADVLNEFRHMNGSLDANAADFAHLEAERTELKFVTQEASDLSLQQDALSARLQQTTKDLNERIARGLELFTRLRSAVRARYGPRNEKLTEFRLRPLRRRRAAAVTKTDPPEKPAPTAPNAPPTT